MPSPITILRVLSCPSLPDLIIGRGLHDNVGVISIVGKWGYTDGLGVLLTVELDSGWSGWVVIPGHALTITARIPASFQLT